MYLGTVCACHIEIKGYLLTYLLAYLLSTIHVCLCSQNSNIALFVFTLPC